MNHPIRKQKKIKSERSIANKIKKWLVTAEEAKNEKGFSPAGINITRLLSIKSLCEGEREMTKQFAFFIAEKIQEQTKNKKHDKYYTEEDRNLFNEAVHEMQVCIANPEKSFKIIFQKILDEINKLQGESEEKVYWNQVIKFIRSDYLMKLEYAIKCFIEKEDYPYWAYKLVVAYIEDSYHGITAKSIPRLLEVADFWCQFYLKQDLKGRFPELITDLTL